LLSACLQGNRAILSFHIRYLQLRVQVLQRCKKAAGPWTQTSNSKVEVSGAGCAIQIIVESLSSHAPNFVCLLWQRCEGVGLLCQPALPALSQPAPSASASAALPRSPGVWDGCCRPCFCLCSLVHTLLCMHPCAQDPQSVHYCLGTLVHNKSSQHEVLPSSALPSQQTSSEERPSSTCAKQQTCPLSPLSSLRGCHQLVQCAGRSGASTVLHPQARNLPPSVACLIYMLHQQVLLPA